MIWPGVTGPLIDNFPAALETPEIYRIGVGDEVTFRQYGLSVGEYTGEGWGLGPKSDILDEYHGIVAPAQSVEAVQYVDRARCFDVAQSIITPTGVAFECVRIDVESGMLGIIERIETQLTVEMFNAGGVVINTIRVAGEDPCVSRVVHPTLGVGDLTWRWVVTRHDLSSQPGGALVSHAATIPAAVTGWPMIPAWTDMRYGTARPSPISAQLVASARSRVRLWLELVGPTNRYAVRVSSRLAGFVQAAGKRFAAVQNATIRHN